MTIAAIDDKPHHHLLPVGDAENHLDIDALLRGLSLSVENPDGASFSLRSGAKPQLLSGDWAPWPCSWRKEEDNNNNDDADGDADAGPEKRGYRRCKSNAWRPRDRQAAAATITADDNNSATTSASVSTDEGTTAPTSPWGRADNDAPTSRRKRLTRRRVRFQDDAASWLDDRGDGDRPIVVAHHHEAPPQHWADEYGYYEKNATDGTLEYVYYPPVCPPMDAEAAAAATMAAPDMAAHHPAVAMPLMPMYGLDPWTQLKALQALAWCAANNIPLP